MGKQLSQYVCLRIVRMDDVDVGLFDRDWNNTIYFFALNADEKIYFRYGGRDSASPDTYLNMDSLELTAAPAMLIRRPVGEVFAAFVDPDVTTKVWFTKSSGRLEAGKQRSPSSPWSGSSGTACRN